MSFWLHAFFFSLAVFQTTGLPMRVNAALQINMKMVRATLIE
jgi:hypothetical protein